LFCGFLRRAEIIARDWIAEGSPDAMQPAAPVAVLHRNSRAEAMHLGRAFRALAHILRRELHLEERFARRLMRGKARRSSRRTDSGHRANAISPFVPLAPRPQGQGNFSRCPAGETHRNRGHSGAVGARLPLPDALLANISFTQLPCGVASASRPRSASMRPEVLPIGPFPAGGRHLSDIAWAEKSPPLRVLFVSCFMQPVHSRSDRDKASKAFDKLNYRDPKDVCANPELAFAKGWIRRG
jgi:hypothetical protein